MGNSPALVCHLLLCTKEMGGVGARKMVKKETGEKEASSGQVRLVVRAKGNERREEKSEKRMCIIASVTRTRAYCLLNEKSGLKCLHFVLYTRVDIINNPRTMTCLTQRPDWYQFHGCLQLANLY